MVVSPLGLSRPVGRRQPNDAPDVARLGRAFARLGYFLEDDERPDQAWRLSDVSDALGRFQRSEGLTTDGYALPGGESERRLVERLAEQAARDRRRAALDAALPPEKMAAVREEVARLPVAARERLLTQAGFDYEPDRLGRLGAGTWRDRDGRRHDPAALDQALLEMAVRSRYPGTPIGDAGRGLSVGARPLSASSQSVEMPQRLIDGEGKQQQTTQTDPRDRQQLIQANRTNGSQQMQRQSSSALGSGLSQVAQAPAGSALATPDSLFALFRKRLAPREGGVANRPASADPGGVTNKGLSKRALDEFRKKPKWKHLPSDPRQVSAAQIDAIFRAEYFDPLHICPEIVIT